MEEKEINRLFTSLVEDPSQHTDEVREVFTMLIRTTLKYRDFLLESQGIVVTVEDVRATLVWLAPAIAMGTLPETDNKLRLNLLKFWLDELKIPGNSKIYSA
jgi:hypothetical protein